MASSRKNQLGHLLNKRSLNSLYNSGVDHKILKEFGPHPDKIIETHTRSKINLPNYPYNAVPVRPEKKSNGKQATITSIELIHNSPSAKVTSPLIKIANIRVNSNLPKSSKIRHFEERESLKSPIEADDKAISVTSELQVSNSNAFNLQVEEDKLELKTTIESCEKLLTIIPDKNVMIADILVSISAFLETRIRLDLLAYEPFIKADLSFLSNSSEIGNFEESEPLTNLAADDRTVSGMSKLQVSASNDSCLQLEDEQLEIVTAVTKACSALIDIGFVMPPIVVEPTVEVEPAHISMSGRDKIVWRYDCFDGRESISFNVFLVRRKNLYKLYLSENSSCFLNCQLSYFDNKVQRSFNNAVTIIDFNRKSKIHHNRDVKHHLFIRNRGSPTTRFHSFISEIISSIYLIVASIVILNKKWLIVILKFPKVIF